MKLIVGLGNPGKEYENSKHNMGFLAIDYFSKRHHVDVRKVGHDGVFGELNLAGERVILLKPQTFMNNSGRSVRKMTDYYKVELEDTLIVYDDIDLDVGTIRLRKGGGPGTHNGMRDIVKALGSNQFPRLRLGVGGDLYGDLVKHVLTGFTKSDWKVAGEMIERSALAIEEWIRCGIDSAMNLYNR